MPKCRKFKSDAGQFGGRRPDEATGASELAACNTGGKVQEML